MKSRKNRAPGRDACAEWHADDGVADVGRRAPRQSAFSNKSDRKTLQLCGQVRRTLGLSLAGCGDEVLRDLQVEAVTPAPDAGRLRVTVCTTGPSLVIADEVLLRLGRFGGRFRADVAATITRKRAPELVFDVRVDSAAAVAGRETRLEADPAAAAPDRGQDACTTVGPDGADRPEVTP